MKKINKILVLSIMLLFPKVVFATAKVSCGNVTGIPEKIPQLTSYIITVMQVAATVILVILGTVDLFKGITSSKEEEMKKGQQTFVKRLITAALVFFVVLIVKLLVGAISNSTGNIITCVDCFVNNDCKTTEESEITRRARMIDTAKRDAKLSVACSKKGWKINENYTKCITSSGKEVDIPDDTDTSTTSKDDDSSADSADKNQMKKECAKIGYDTNKSGSRCKVPRNVDNKKIETLCKNLGYDGVNSDNECLYKVAGFENKILVLEYE